jgi:hydrogenase nickel incorporation protein HypA/HybF
MHELSLAQAVIEIAEAEAKKHSAPAVATVKLRLGEFAGVVREALEFGFEFARRGTAVEGARLEIETVPLKTRCPHCKTVGRPIEDFCLICPTCGGAVKSSRGGKWKSNMWSSWRRLI